MVEGADALLRLAQFAVALGGFIGVVIMFRGTEAGFHPIDSLRIQFGLTGTLGPAFLALLPAGLSLTGLSGAFLWGVCSTLGAILVVVAYVAIEIRGRRRLPPALKAQTGRTMVGIYTTLGGLCPLGLLVINLSGLWLGPGPGLYFLALVSMLAGGAVAFVRIVFVRPRGPAA